MVKIRLFRTGTTKRPMYRIVAMDERRQRQGRVLEILGTYQPRKDGEVQVRLDAVERWIGKGAQTTDTVASLIRRHRRERAAAEVADTAAAPATPAPAETSPT